MSKLDPGFLDRARLLHGPWQAFERDVAEIFLGAYSDHPVCAPATVTILPR